MAKIDNESIFNASRDDEIANGYQLIDNLQDDRYKS